ncbi:MAG: MFS transporter [Gaiellaceae bacterium]
MSGSNRKWWTLGAVAFGLFMIMLDNTIVTVALPTIKRDLGLGISELEWIVTAYTLTFAAFILIGGKLADLLGRRLMFNVGLGIFTISSLVCGFAGNASLLIGARAVQGVGAAIMVPSTLSIVTAAFPPRQRGTAIGVWAGTAGMALAIGPLLGGILTQQLSWHWIFFVNIPVGALAMVVSRIVILESRDTSREQSLDLLGLVTSGASLFALTYALIEGNGKGWSSPLIIGLFVLAGVLLLVFLLLELHQRLPMLELSLFKIGNFVGSILVALLVSLAIFGVFFFMSLYVQNILGYSPTRAGASFLPMTILIILVAPFAGRYSDRIGSRWLMAFGMALVGISLYLFSRVGLHTTYPELLPAMSIGGIGMPMAMSPTTAAAMATVPVDKAGVGAAVLNSFRQVGGALGIALLGAVMASKSSSVANAARTSYKATVRKAAAQGIHLPRPTAEQKLAITHKAFVEGLHSALHVSAAIAFGAVLVAAVLVRKRHHEHAEDPQPAAESV